MKAKISIAIVIMLQILLILVYINYNNKLNSLDIPKNSEFLCAACEATALPYDCCCYVCGRCNTDVGIKVIPPEGYSFDISFVEFKTYHYTYLLLIILNYILYVYLVVEAIFIIVLRSILAEDREILKSKSEKLIAT